MKFRTMCIVKDIRNTNEYRVFDTDCISKETSIDKGPDDNGYYHYSTEKSKQEAFNELKLLLIKNKKEQIKRLQEDLNKLENIEI